MRTYSILLVIFLLITVTTFSQTTPKQLAAKRISAPIKIDGNLNEDVWKGLTAATDFIENRPTPWRKEDPANKTEVYILYDNTAIYIGGYCHERNVDSVSKELVGRDKIGASDFIGAIFDTYNDNINGSGFYVTPYGEQYDAKYSSTGGEDDSWNAVWESDAKMQSDGWTFEMRIPYSALRFSNKETQLWGLNIIRRRQKTGQQMFWNPLDPNKNGLMNQEGLLTGIEKVSPPLRLSFSPYFSTYLNHYPYNTAGIKNVTSSVNGGMDVKYGISQSFTLDMTLVPDFGQVQSDNRVLNLSPFEVKYNENRSFFTEGTELFNKGNLFYSRRIGSQPLHRNDVYFQVDTSKHEQVIKNPSETKLINATKISGRTAKGLGIGVFNAVTNPMYAVIEDDHGNKRRVNTNPLTNYNILVLDQTMKNNSSVSLINSNVWRAGKDYDANVTAGLFDIYNKKNTYNWFGKAALSQLMNVNGKNITGYAHNAGFAKTGGHFNFNIIQELTDDKYNPNDLGILYNNNYLYHYLYIGYRWTKPTKWYNNIYFNNNFNYYLRYKPGAYQSFNYNFNVNGQLKNLWFVGIYAAFNAHGNDFYEPRVNGRFYRTPQSFAFNVWMNSNGAKKYSYNINLYTTLNDLFRGRLYEADLNHTYRFSDKFSLSQATSITANNNNAGFADKSGNDVIFSRRNVKTIENIINAKYNFNKRTGITFRTRHYWSRADAKEFFTLNTDGTLLKNSLYNKNADINFNIFNIDMVYTWQFGPGSFINLVWKNEIQYGNQDVASNYFKNFNNTISASQNNNISLKILYYLDVLKFRKKSSQ